MSAPKEQGILKIRAEYYPKVTLDGATFSENRPGRSASPNRTTSGGTRPTFWRISYDERADLRWVRAPATKLDIAEADLHQAEKRTCWSARDSAARDVWKAYTGYRTALKKQDAARKNY